MTATADTLVEIGLFTLGVVVLAMSCLWVVSLIKRNASIVDLFWGTGFVLIAWATYAVNASPGASALTLVTLTTLWGLRLSGYLLWRNWGQAEDYRYREMREKRGRRFPLASLLTVFLLQGVLMWFVSFPVQFGQIDATQALGWLAWPGIAVWMVGMGFETIGDFQLARFKSRPENTGHVMDRGLWRYTRHPNYFGDFCVWWGLYLLAASAGAWWTVASPLLMSFLLIRVSGVGLLERTISDRRPGYTAYMKQTNAFFPGPRKRADV